jgi:hypothetical protein
MANSSDSRFDYVTVGHVTRDVIEDRAGGTVSQPGGGAFYSALQASRLGLRTLIVTQGVPREIETLLEPYREELELHLVAARYTTTLVTRGVGAKRSQRLLAWAGPMLAPHGLDTAVLHLAPIARETAPAWDGDVGFLGITPQGLARWWEQRDEVALVQLDGTLLDDTLLDDMPLSESVAEISTGSISPVELDAGALPERFDAAVISEHERQSCRALFTVARRAGACVAVTAGARPTTVHLPLDADQPKTDTEPKRMSDSGTGVAAVVRTASPPPVQIRDDLGAGDVFAAAFFVALSDGCDPLAAADFGNAAASIRVAGVGPGAIGRREQIDAMLTP